MPTFHPQALIQHPQSKAQVWTDLKAVMRQLGLKTASSPSRAPSRATLTDAFVRYGRSRPPCSTASRSPEYQGIYLCFSVRCT